MNIIIIPARPADADFIACCVMEAIGDEICGDLARNNRTLDDVRRVFATLAAREDTQYSYRNTLVAVDEDGTQAGACVAYDGAGLEAMREHFFKAAKEILDLDLSGMDPECEAGEFYLDTLAVSKSYRGQGIARALIKATAVRAAECGKKLGLLVEKENHNARRLYDSVGFRQVGETPFAFVLMDHLQMD